jgi:hypothetical protein
VVETVLMGLVGKALEKVAATGLAKAFTNLKINGKRSDLQAAVARIRKIEFVKTLWQIDKEISIYEFFVPPRASYLNDSFDILDFASLPEGRNLVIEGILGQGKSTLLRHLALSCIKHGLLPIFISANTISDKKPLRAKIQEYLTDFCRAQVLDREVEKLLESQFFVLFIDGFDEVSQSEESALIEDLRSLSRRYDNSLRIVVSSRPDNGVQKCEEFRVIKLLELDKNGRNALVEKLLVADRAAELLISLDRHLLLGADELLRTPLMVVILIVVYNAERRVPETYTEFFEHLFEFLLVRHDATKPGYSRKRKTTLSNSQFRQLFEAFCFVTRQDDLASSMTIREVEESIQLAAETINLQVNVSDYVADVRGITCLLIEEGLKLHFIHPAIQYFFSAEFIRSSSDEDAKDFYQDLTVDTNWIKWAPELGFLRRIDVHNFYEYFYNDGLKKRRYFSENAVLTLDEIKEISSSVVFEIDGSKVLIRVKSGAMSMAERDFLADFYVRSLVNEGLPNALSLPSPAGVSKQRSREDIFETAARYALSQFRARIDEIGQIEISRARRSALLKRK